MVREAALWNNNWLPWHFLDAITMLDALGTLHIGMVLLINSLYSCLRGSQEVNGWRGLESGDHRVSYLHVWQAEYASVLSSISSSQGKQTGSNWTLETSVSTNARIVYTGDFSFSPWQWMHFLISGDTPFLLREYKLGSKRQEQSGVLHLPPPARREVQFFLAGKRKCTNWLCSLHELYSSQPPHLGLQGQPNQHENRLFFFSHFTE